MNQWGAPYRNHVHHIETTRIMRVRRIGIHNLPSDHMEVHNLPK